MILLNMAKCLITIKHKEDSYMLFPAGDAVTLPDAALNGAVQALIDTGEIKVIEAAKASKVKA